MKTLNAHPYLSATLVGVLLGCAYMALVCYVLLP